MFRLKSSILASPQPCFPCWYRCPTARCDSPVTASLPWRKQQIYRPRSLRRGHRRLDGDWGTAASKNPMTIPGNPIWTMENATKKENWCDLSEKHGMNSSTKISRKHWNINVTNHSIAQNPKSLIPKLYGYAVCLAITSKFQWLDVVHSCSWFSWIWCMGGWQGVPVYPIFWHFFTMNFFI